MKTTIKTFKCSVSLRRLDRRLLHKTGVAAIRRAPGSNQYRENCDHDRGLNLPAR